jgi:hypothetical protein
MGLEHQRREGKAFVKASSRRSKRTDLLDAAWKNKKVDRTVLENRDVKSGNTDTDTSKTDYIPGESPVKMHKLARN